MEVTLPKHGRRGDTAKAPGLTNLIDLAFDGAGRLSAQSIAADGLLTPGPSGTLWRIRPGQSPVKVIGGLTQPGGVATRDGYAYITDCGTCAGDGKIIRVALDSASSRIRVWGWPNCDALG